MRDKISCTEANNTGVLLTGIPSRHTRGFTMVEVLVSIIIFSIGLIGIARLQVVAKQSNHDAVQRVTATAIADDIISRMRANASELAAYTKNGDMYVIGGGTLSAPSCGATSTSTCTSAQLVDKDMYEIEQLLDGAGETDTNGNAVGGLVLPTACVDGPAAGGAGVYTVAIAWRGKADLTNPTLHACGSSTSNYGSNNEYRRLLVFQTYITT